MKQKKPRPLKIAVRLNPEDLSALIAVTKQGRHPVREVTRARILLLSHAHKTNSEIVDMLGCAPRMICTVRNRYQRCTTIMDAIKDASRPGQPKKITPKHEAFVVATACTDAPPRT